jgi:nicotinate-nucleotide--dimethylbenzimidazole phosphoribosyltransferase
MNQMTDLRIQIDERIGRLCKPPGSLGDLEMIARRLCLIQNTIHPVTKPRRVTIFAADHGVTREGVSAWPSQVTAAVSTLMLAGRTASGVFANALDASYELVDVGLLRDIFPQQGSEEPKVSFSRNGNGRPRGTKNLLVESAMTEGEFDDAWQAGVDRANGASEMGNRLVIGGEMGIGNTTSASCLACLLANVPIEAAIGRGAGIDDQGMSRKRAVVEQAVARVRLIEPITAQQIASEVGGLEIVALAGFYARAAQLGLTIVLDGFIATAAALVAEAIYPGTCRSMIAGHLSTEPGHMSMLSHLGLVAMLDMKLRLGEGTGALAALSLIDLSAAMMNHMATLDDLAIL